MVDHRPPAQPAPSVTIPGVRTLKDAIDQWLHGDIDQGLTTPLKDWDKKIYMGRNHASIGAIYGKHRWVGERFIEYVAPLIMTGNTNNSYADWGKLDF
jgi:hypothetical protein